MEKLIAKVRNRSMNGLKIIKELSENKLSILIG
jgi:hypothetical protein